MKKFILDLNKGILEKLNITMEQLKEFEYIPDKNELKRLQNKRYYEAHKEKVKAKNREKARLRRLDTENDLKS